MQVLRLSSPFATPRFAAPAKKPRSTGMSSNRTVLTHGRSRAKRRQIPRLISFVDLTSQTWRTPRTAIDRCGSTGWACQAAQDDGPTAFLFIVGGITPVRLRKWRTKPSRIATETNTVAIELAHGAQPAGGFPQRRQAAQEDDLIAYTWDQYLRAATTSGARCPWSEAVRADCVTGAGERPRRRLTRQVRRRRRLEARLDHGAPPRSINASSPSCNGNRCT